MPDGINEIDTQSLQDYLQPQLTGLEAPLTATKFSGGQSNPTFLLEAGTQRYVLRKQPPGELLKSAHAVDREFRVMQALDATPVPVPTMHLLCEDRDVIGEMFFVMEYVAGRTFWDSALPEQEVSERTAIYKDMGRVLANLANVDYEQIGLADFGRPGNYFARQLKRWSEQYRLTAFREIVAMEWIMPWLHEHMPPDDGRTALVHGDFRLDNLRYAQDTATVSAILDWELSTLGHPLADLANLCMQMRAPTRMANMSGLAGRDLAALGIPSEQEFIDQYSADTGISIGHWPFYLAFSLFRLAAILQGVAKRGREGNASNPQALQLADHVEPLADLAVTIAREQH